MCIRDRQTIENGYILGGSSSSNVAAEKTDSCRGYNDYWIIKLSSNGTLDCLLYTSPSPRDRTRSRMPSSA